MPNIGFWATAGAGGAAAAAYELISTQTPNGVASISFNSIPSTYSHLQVRIVPKTSNASNGFCYPAFTFNNDTSSVYDNHELYATGGGPLSQAMLGRAYMNIAYLNDSYNSTNMFGGAIVDILNYGSTAKNKTVRSLAGYTANGSQRVSLYSGAWRNTAAISSIQVFFSFAGGNFVAGSRVSLYGIKG